MMDKVETLSLIDEFYKAEVKYTKYIDELETNKSALQNLERRQELALAYNNRGHAKYNQVKFDEATEDYNQAIYYNPELHIAYYNRGTIYYRMGEFQKASDDFQKSLQLVPTFEDANIAFKKSHEQLALLFTEVV